jgi:hypothetical protein
MAGPATVSKTIKAGIEARGLITRAIVLPRQFHRRDTENAQATELKDGAPRACNLFFSVSPWLAFRQGAGDRATANCEKPVFLSPTVSLGETPRVL